MAKRKKATPSSIAHGLWNLAAYIRLSRDDGEDESLSVINQRKIIDEFVLDYFDDGSAIVDYYVDDGVTGTDYDRPEFQRLMHDIETKKVNCVIVKTPSRAFRNYADQGYFLESFFPRNQVRFISISNPRVDSFENPDSVTGLELPIMGLMNDRFAAQTSEQVRRTFNMKRRNGEFIGAFAPYGYEKDPENKNRLIIDDDAASIVCEIFHWFVCDGISKNGIVKRLNDRGVPNPALYKRKKGHRYNSPFTKANDGLWNPATIHRLLQNRMYIGHMVQGKQKIVSYKVHDRLSIPEDQWFVKEDVHEPIISRELFEQAQALMLRDARSISETSKLSLFAGFIRCPDCNKAMRRKSSKGYAYYICRTYSEKSKAECTSHAIRETILTELVFHIVKAQIDMIDQLAEVIDAVQESPLAHTKSSNLDLTLESRRNEYEKLRSTVEELYLDYKNGLISLDEYKSMKPKLTERLEMLAEVVKDLEKEKSLYDEGTTSQSSWLDEFRKWRNITKLDRNVLSALVEMVYIHENKNVTICFKHSDQLERAYEYMVENGAGLQVVD